MTIGDSVEETGWTVLQWGAIRVMRWVSGAAMVAVFVGCVSQAPIPGAGLPKEVRYRCWREAVTAYPDRADGYMGGYIRGKNRQQMFDACAYASEQSD